MDNQHKLIKGYRDLSQQEIDLINEGKELSAQVGAWISKLEESLNFEIRNLVDPDPRWLEAGKTDLQKGFMSVIRSIAKPTSF
jgi:hypothetical protein